MRSKLRRRDLPSVLLLALNTGLPLVAAAPAQYGLSPIAGAYIGLAAAMVAAIAGVILNQSDAIGE